MVDKRSVGSGLYDDMKPWEIRYAGISSEDIGFVVGHYSKPLAPQLTRSAVDIPGRFGDLYLGTSYGAKTFSIPITIVAENAEDYYRIHENLTTALYDPFEDPEEVYPLVFGDDPHKAEYFGHFSEIPDPTFATEGTWVATTTLTFTCSDPKGYLPEKDVKITEPVSTVKVEGNSEVYPIIHVNVKKPIQHFGYVKGEEYVAVGNDKDFDTDDPNYIQDKEPVALSDPCETMAGFNIGQPSTFEIVNGFHAGSLRGTGSSITVNYQDKSHPDNGRRDWGKTVKENAWHGPAMTHTPIPNATKDWQIEFRFHHTKYYNRAMGKIEVYLLDVDGKRRGRVSIKDKTGGTAPGMLMDFGPKNGDTHYVVGQNEMNPYRDWKEGGWNGKNKKVRLTNKKKVKVTYYKKEGRKKVKKTKYVWKTVNKDLDDFNNHDIFSNFYGSVRIRKVGKTFTWKVVFCDSNDGSVVKELFHGTWTMTDAQAKKYDFALSTFAVYMGKMDITEDRMDPVKTYHEPYLAFSYVKIWNIIDGGNENNGKPTNILQAGDELIIDTERKHTYRNGMPFDYETAMGSTYPTWNTDRDDDGNAVVGFDPEPGSSVDIGITYRPTYQ